MSQVLQAGTPEWHSMRMTGLGGSDAAAALGVSPWKTKFELYQEKRGEAPRLSVPTNAKRWGHYLEPAIRQAYADITGRQVMVPDQVVRHPKYDFMLANLDGYTHGKRVFEAKSARTDAGWGQEGSDQIPLPYLLQVQHYMAVTQFDVADVAVLIGGSDFRLYEVPADPELQEYLIEGEMQFWDNVQRGEPPEPETYRDVIARYGQSSREGEAEATLEMVEAIEALQSVKRTQQELDEAEEALKTKVMKMMGDIERLSYHGQTLVTWKATKPRTQFDIETFRKSHPALYAEFCKECAPTRRFLLKNYEAV